jgi:hypothetical protein
MTGQNRSLPIALLIALLGCLPALAKPGFQFSELEGQGSEIVFCDLDGDHLKDVVLVDGLNLSIFYQDSKAGFPRKPQQQFRLEDRAAVVWPARLGRNAESLLVMTSEGITELCFTNRTDPPACRQIIKQQTIIPEKLSEKPVIHFPLSAKTGTDWPLLLVPTPGGLQVWQHRDGWRQAQCIEQAMDTHLWASVWNPGYHQSFGLNLALDDVNGDGRDDLMVMHYDVVGWAQLYALYLQQADGLFNLEPALVYTNKADWRTALHWVDINRDGKLDLIKGTFLDEPFFIPGLPSSKVLISICRADERGRIPAEPQQVFRKSDWSTALPVVDLDGDGFVDLVLGNVPIDSRETVRKMITAEQVELNLKIYFYRPGAGFPKDPDCQHNMLIHFGREFLTSFDRRVNFEALYNLNGDFNGDGKKDLAVMEHRKEIAVYFFVSRETGFSPKADLKFSCPESIDSWEVNDLNGDGVSDLIVKSRKPNTFWIFTSQRN